MLEREKKIKESGVREVFTPHTPVQSIELFFGRQATVQKLIEHLNTPGQHALLFGDRGVGKSSLANVTTEKLIGGFMNVELFVKRCSSQDNFQSIFAEPLMAVGHDVNLATSEVESERTGSSGINAGFAKAGVNSKAKSKLVNSHGPVTPSDVARLLSEREGLFYIDEADQIHSEEDQIALAETIKLLSDSNSPFKLLIVGIAETGADLYAGHRSIERCVKETKLQRMHQTEIEELISNGGKKCGLYFDVPVVKSIVKLSAGYPHFAHLLALKCAEDAIGMNRKFVNVSLLRGAIIDAVKDAEASLQRSFNLAISSPNRETIKNVLLGAARIASDQEFSTQAWRESIEEIIDDDLPAQAHRNYVRKLVSEAGDKIIRRVRKGMYKFSDPRMPSFVKLEAETRNYD